MNPIDTITQWAQDQYFEVNGAENDDTGDDLILFQNNYIRAFNLWIREYETETFWNVARTNDYELATIADTVTYSFTLPDTYRSPIFDENKYLKFVLSDGTIVAKFALVDPNQRIVDSDIYRKDRATFIPAGSVDIGGGTIVLSRAPRDEEVGAKIVLDVVKRFPELTRDDDTVLNWVYSRRIASLGVSKNVSLADVTKVSLSPSFAQKYANELNKALNANIASTRIDEMPRDDYSNIGGIW
jgi:hypothetical protein